MKNQSDLKKEAACDRFSSPEYRRSRTAYLFECAFEYFVALLVSDAFLVKLMKDIGMKDAAIGIVSSLISLAFLFQILSIFIVQKISRVKAFSSSIHFISQLMFLTLYLIPFLPCVGDGAYRRVLTVICILLAYLGKHLVNSMIYTWANSFVSPMHRAKYGASKEMVSLISGMAVTLIIGYVMDAFEMAGNLHGGFLFAACGILIFSICDLVCLLMIRDRTKTQEIHERVSIPMREILRGTFGNKAYRSVLLLTVLWNMAVYTTVSFLGTYRLNPNELALTVGAVQIVNMLGNLLRFSISRPFGLFSDRYSFAKGIELGLGLAICAFTVAALTSPGNAVKVWVLVILFAMLYHGSQAGISQNLFTIVYNYVDSRYFVQASAIKNSIGGIFGFLASLLASRLLAYVQGNGNSLFGIPVYGQQVLAAISVLFTVAALLVTHFIVAKQRRIIQ